MEAETTQTQTQTEAFDPMKWAAWLHTYQKQLAIALVAAAVVGSGIGIYAWKKGQDEINANQAFFSLPPVFGARNTHPKADALAKLAQEYPGTSVGQQSALLAAGVLFTDGKYAEAQKAFSDFLTEYPSSPLAPQASVGVAASIEGQGQIDPAIQKYLDVVQKYPSDGVVAPVKLTLARLYESKNDFEKAFRTFDDVSKSPNPYDPWASEAKERKELLLARHPELSKLIAPPVSISPTPAPGASAKPTAKPTAPVPTAKPAVPAPAPKK